MSQSKRRSHLSAQPLRRNRVCYKLVEAEIIEFLKYVEKEYELELSIPRVITEENGDKFIYGAKEAAGYDTVNKLIEEWRNGG